jgi:hypothetical protein
VASATTIASWAKSGVMEKVSHGVFDLKKSLENWVMYQRCILEADGRDPMMLFEIRQDLA